MVPIYQAMRKMTSNNFLLLLAVPIAKAIEGTNSAPDSKAKK